MWISTNGSHYKYRSPDQASGFPWFVPSRTKPSEAGERWVYDTIPLFDYRENTWYRQHVGDYLVYAEREAGGWKAGSELVPLPPQGVMFENMVGGTRVPARHTESQHAPTA